MLYTLLITLKDRKPLSERTVQIDGNLTFANFANLICDLYGLDGEHLREFIEKEKICINHPDIDVTTLQQLDTSDPDIHELLDATKQLSGSTFHLYEYFTDTDKIIFSYDFGTPRTFVVKKIAEEHQKPLAKKIVLLGWKGSYLVEDTGWPQGLKEYLHEYKEHKRDEDRWESWKEFEQRLKPAMTKFDKKNHPELLEK